MPVTQFKNTKIWWISVYSKRKSIICAVYIEWKYFLAAFPLFIDFSLLFSDLLSIYWWEYYIWYRQNHLSRVNTLLNLHITCFYLSEEECTFTFESVLKHPRPNFRIKPITYSEMPELCSVRSIQEYLKFRLSRSPDPQFLITTNKPFKGASKSTIAR